MKAAPRNTILIGDAVERLAELPSSSVDCVVTSPPYFGLRDYHVSGQLGAEPTVSDWVRNLQAVFHEVARVLVPTGSVFLNLGDSFSRHPKYGAPAKSLLLAPERLLLALADDGWIVRNKLVWAKTNPQPSSVHDRLTLTYEPIYFLVRQRSYFFDLDAIREPHRTSPAARPRKTSNRQPDWAGPLATSRRGLDTGAAGHPLGKNPGDVWPIATRGFKGAHFATFPPDLVRRPVLAGCPQVVCTKCGQGQRQRQGTLRCHCKAPARSGLVLDPFFGTGTVGLVAAEQGRDWLGIELNPDYARIAEQRLGLVPRIEAITTNHLPPEPVTASPAEELAS
ncbi:DNA modification methylase [Kribbella sp. VKM Ac-2527]|uniref:Methyltransferase n=1 Tax=Kribbella caucasensis TaxID=2512215 RepID=A0A4V3C5P5_9ACTN|nr:DNA modification methylase [Kribbella sp. VKM Ac-2527]